MSTLGRGARVAVVGVWHFLIGDTPVFLPAVLALVGFALAFRHLRLVDVMGLPLLVLVVLAAGLWRGQRRLRGPAAVSGRREIPHGCAPGDSNPQPAD